MIGAAIWGFIGGLAGEFLNVYEHRERDPDNWPNYFRRWSYWGTSFGMALTGAIFAVAYHQSGVDMSPIAEINIGVTAPLILKSLRRGGPGLSPGSVN